MELLRGEICPAHPKPCWALSLASYCPSGASEKLGKVFSIHMCVYIYIYRRGYFQALDIVNTLKAEMQFLSPRAELGVCQCFRVNLPGPGCVTALCLLKVPEEDTER